MFRVVDLEGFELSAGIDDAQVSDSTKLKKRKNG